MTTADSSSPKVETSLVSRILRRFVAGAWLFVKCLLLLWATLAIFFSNLPWEWLRLAAAIAFAAFSIWALWISKNRKMRWAVAAAFLVVLVWYIAIPPSHDRPWRREVAVMPRATIDGDRVHITGFRNFEYRTVDDFTEHYEERDVDLSHLESVDFYISYWAQGPVGHTLLSFNFDNAPPVCISIETRPEVGEGFSPIRSLFKQFELIYVVGDERDLVRSRTNYRDEDVFLYHINSPPEAAKRLFLVYMERINELADHPEWYHLLKNNCTLNIVRYRNRARGQGGFDYRHLINGWADQYLYQNGFIDNTLPFEELRRRAHINSIALATSNALDANEFSRRIRGVLPGGTASSAPEASGPQEQ